MIWNRIEQIRVERPLVLNITNYVVMNTTANALLAVGASPVMAHAIEEVEELTRLAKALVINIGTLSAPWVESMVKAGKEARRRNIPIVLDPVGCGATNYRTATALNLVREIGPSVIRGNASEIRALVRADSAGKGVDSLHTPDEVQDDAGALSRQAGCVVSVSGPVDMVVDRQSVVRIANGDPMMARVTGMGCTASALTGAFLAVCDSPLNAATYAMGVMGVAGEIAAERAVGPGSFQMQFLDALYGIQEFDLSHRLKIQTR